MRTGTMGRMASLVGRGLVAGLIGTAAMTVSSTIESKLRRRPPSTVPAEVGGEVLGVEPKGEEGEKRLGNLVHWQYGTGLGVLRGALGGFMRDPWAGAVFFGVAWAGSLLMVPRLSEETPPPAEWGTTEVVVDGWHHLVYAAATSLAFSNLLRTGRRK